MAIVLALRAASPVEELGPLALKMAEALGVGLAMVPLTPHVHERVAAVLRSTRRGPRVVVEKPPPAGARQALLEVVKHHSAAVLLLGAASDDDGASDAAWWLSRATGGVPTLLIRDPAPLLTWARGAQRLRVVVYVSASAAGRSTLVQLHQLRRMGSCDATVVHLVDPIVEHTRLGLTTRIPQRGLLPSLERYLLDELREWTEHASLIPASLTFRVVRARSNVPGQLVSFTQRHAADLVVVGVGEAAGVKALLRPSASKPLVACARNVLCVPPPEVAATPLPRFRRVLAATDLTAHGNSVVPAAYSLAAPMGEVHLIHAVLGDEDRREIKTRLKTLVPAAAQTKQITTHLAAPSGIDVVATVAAYAERLAVDALCLSTRARGRLIGSLARDLLRRCRRPVFMIPPQRHDP